VSTVWHARDAVFVGAAYGVLYYYIAYGALRQVETLDRIAGSRSRSRANSVAIVAMLFNFELPRPSYPKSLKWRLRIARIMLALWPVILAAIALFPGYAKY